MDNICDLTENWFDTETDDEIIPLKKKDPKLDHVFQQNQSLIVQVQTLTENMQTLLQQNAVLEKQVLDIYTYIQQQKLNKIIERVTLPFLPPDSNLFFNRARATNFALRQHIPIAFVKSESTYDHID